MKTFNIYPALSYVFFLVFIASCFTSLSAQTSLLYGLTYGCGVYPGGAIISFNPANKNENVQWIFNNDVNKNDGANPNGNLVYDSINGLFYGTTRNGGDNGSGAIISFNPSNNEENVVWSFGRGSDGGSPLGSLVYYAANGLFYATTSKGGDNGSGAIISFNPVNNYENVVWSFGGDTDGSGPWGNLAYNPDNGIFYAFTPNGGSNNQGAIISFNPAQNSEKVLWSFGSGTDGAYPYGDLVYNSSNALFYGMTYEGGSNNRGAIISFNPSSNEEHVLWSFGSGTDGQYPYGSLVRDTANGLYYGMTSTGGSSNNGGAIITFNPSNNEENVVWNFGSSPNDGQVPIGNLVYNSNDRLFYGVTENGGTYSVGTIISFNPANNSENALWSFGNGNDGELPSGSLVLYTKTNDSCEAISASIVNIDDSSAYIKISGGAPPYSYNWNTTPVQHTDTATGLSAANSYNVTVTYHRSCSVSVSYITTTGIALENNAPAPKIYPNPANNLLALTGLSESQIVTIYNYQGQMLIRLIAHDISQTFDISTLANGLYIVEILNTDGTVANETRVMKINE